MTNDNLKNWELANQQYLMSAVRLVKAELELFETGQSGSSGEGKKQGQEIIDTESLQEEAGAALPSPSALDTVVDILGLSSFERKILLMCAGVELDADFAALLIRLQGNVMQMLPTFSLAMAVFSDAHWSALSPGSPLRYWRLVELTNQPLITKSAIRIDEQLLHYLTGMRKVDERLAEIIEPVLPDRFLVSSHISLAERLEQSFRETVNAELPPPVIRLSGNEADKAAIAAQAASALGRRLFSMSFFSIPLVKRELTELIRLWNREAAINGYALYLDCDDADTSDKLRIVSVQYFIENVQGLVFVSTDHWAPQLKRHFITHDIQKPTVEEQSSLWRTALGNHEIELNGQLDKLVSQFNMSSKIIQQVSLEAGNAAGTGDLKKDLWKLCCQHSRPRLDELAQRIEPVSHWDDIVLPQEQKDMLQEIAMQVKQRKKVYVEWGFEGRSSRGLGISAMFTGESGTGKTMAAEVLANELQLDLYRIDLSQVVNKYIGETEKNLKRIFDAADDGGAILLFDEADALFGKRSEVKDSHDRYGNIEVSYLLQRMEAYRGLAILTTNMKNSLDKAFMRRIRFVVQFAFPGLAQRAEIWGKVFPKQTPRAELDLQKLAKLSLPGGNIRNIALNAAFIAADENTTVGMSHILRAARSEYDKLEKTMNSIDIEMV
jgi:ATP-dependent 26S proteasome regulatory subunit